MLVREVLEAHRAASNPDAHPDILGDAYLIRANPVYAAIKSAARVAGAEFVEAYPRYLLMPFHELGTIVKTKRIPYVPSAKLLEEIERQRPGAFRIEDLNVPESYHLHEAAHVIAENLFVDLRLTGERELIMKMLICESFANTVDALACAPFPGDDAHYYFLSKNCYMQPDEKRARAMVRLQNGIGPRFTFALTFFTYLQSNFLKDPLTREDLVELAARHGATLSPKQMRDCETVGRSGEKLDLQFRVLTTGNYLKLEGFPGDVFEILDFPIRQTFNGNPAFTTVVDAMSALF